MDRRAFIQRLPPFVVGSAVAIRQAPQVIERLAEEARWARLPTATETTADEVREWLTDAAGGLQRYVANPYPAGSAEATTWRVMLDQKIVGLAHEYTSGSAVSPQEGIQILRTALGLP